MSRSQTAAAAGQAKSEAATNFGDSQNSYTKAQEDVGNYENQLASYAASDPFKPGGEFQTAENKVLSGVAGGVADSARTELQSSGARRGENPALANAAAEEIADRSQRTLAGEEGTAEEQRINSEAGYNKSVLGATEFPVQAESNLYKDTSGASNQELDAAISGYSKAPSFGDEFGDAFGSALGKTLGGGNNSKG